MELRFSRSQYLFARFENLEISSLDRLLSPDLVQFRSACLRTEIFLRELTLSSTLSSNPKSSHSVDPQFSHKLVFYVHKIHDKFFHCLTTRMDADTRLHNSKWLIPVNQS